MMFAAERLRKKWTGEKVVILPPLDDDASAARLAGMFKPGDFVFLKGSRRMGLERVAKSVKAALDGARIGPAANAPRSSSAHG
jgi:UDP-N-acetylmuramyl pentapeptide synthase